MTSIKTANDIMNDLIAQGKNKEAGIVAELIDTLELTALSIKLVGKRVHVIHTTKSLSTIGTVYAVNEHNGYARVKFDNHITASYPPNSLEVISQDKDDPTTNQNS